MSYSDDTVNRVVEAVRSLASESFVRDVEDHFAGYFDELGLTINLTDSVTDVEWRGLANKLLRYLNSELPNPSVATGS